MDAALDKTIGKMFHLMDSVEKACTETVKVHEKIDLQIDVIAGRALATHEDTGNTQPIAKVWYKYKEIGKTQHLRGQDVSFNLSCSIRDLDLDSSGKVHVEIKHRRSGHHLTRESQLGYVEITTLDLQRLIHPHYPVERWFRLVDGCGRVHLRLTVLRSSRGQSSVLFKNPAQQFPSSFRIGRQVNLPVTIYASSFAGNVLWLAGESGQDMLYRVYSISLAKVNEIFGSVYQNWNTNYKQAQKIFAKDDTATMRPTLVDWMVSYLYKSPEWYRPTKADEMPTIGRDNIDNVRDFFELLNFGFREGKPRFFTYVMSDTTLNFSETSKGIRDFLSKHAVHSQRNEQVRYSGEFHIEPLDPLAAEHRVVFDNNSGTYAPDPALLPKVAAVMEANLPGLQVEALARDDPKLVQYTKAVSTAQKLYTAI
eukprot:TRINITY_DN25702_c0_g1_i1.p1 TRINITY_DN25702_c0_g1~~TRINITY_DN25702_c0_g1_i1.p1  ORF type:complete len:435 (-),score=17.29 TRINITY_DN25702_c0_g1_i1:148-1419(-)